MFPARPLITEFWQAALLLAVGIGVVALITRYARRRAERDRRNADERN